MNRCLVLVAFLSFFQQSAFSQTLSRLKRSEVMTVEMQTFKNFQAQYCRDGMNELCAKHVLYSDRAKRMILQNNDLGIAAATKAAVDVMRTRFKKGLSDLETDAEMQGMGMMMNSIISDYNAAKEKAKGNGGAWNDDASVGILYEVVQKADPTKYGVGSMATEFLANLMHQQLAPFVQLDSQKELVATHRLKTEMLASFSEKSFLDESNPAFKDVTDTALAAYGLESYDSLEEALDNPDAVNDQMLALVLKDIQILKGNSATGEQQTNLLKKMYGIILEADARAKKEQEEKKQMELINDFESGVRLYNSLSFFFPTPQAQKFFKVSSTVATATLTVYKTSLNIGKIGKMAATADVVGAIVAVFSLFAGGGPSEYQIISKQIEDLQKSVNQLHEDLLKTQQEISNQINDLFKFMAEGFEQIQKNQSVTIEMLKDLQSASNQTLRHLIETNVLLPDYFEELAKIVSEDSLPVCLNKKGWFVRHILSEGDFKKCADSFLRWAKERSVGLAASATKPEDLELAFDNPAALLGRRQINIEAIQFPDRASSGVSYDLDQAFQILEKVNPLKRVNYLGVLTKIHLGTSIFNERKMIPSPVIYIQAAQAFLDLYQEQPEHRKVLSATPREDMLQVAEEILATSQKLRSNEFIEALFFQLKALAEKLPALATAASNQYLGEGLKNFAGNAIWQSPPETTSVDLPVTDSISRTYFKTENDLAVKIPQSAIHPLGKVLNQLRGGGQVTYSANWAGKKDESGFVWADHIHQHKGQRNLRDGVRITNGTWKTKIQILWTVEVAGHVVSRCESTSRDWLIAGDYRDTHRGGRVIDRKVSTRSPSDILNQVWDDKSYRMKDTFECRATDEAAGELRALIAKEWKAHQASALQRIVDVFGAQSKTELDSVQRTTHSEFITLWRMLENAAPWGFATITEKNPEFVDLLLGDASPVSLRRLMAEVRALQKTAASGTMPAMSEGSPMDAVFVGFKKELDAAKDLTLKAASQMPVEESIPEVDRIRIKLKTLQ